MNQMAYIIQSGAWVVGIICSIVLVGYGLQLAYLTTWAGDTRMAIPTAICLFIVSICLWVAGHLLGRQKE